MNKKTFWIIAVVNLCLFFGCSSLRIIPDNEKMDGFWIFKEVKYFKPFSFRANDITDQFNFHRIRFYQDNTLIYNNGMGKDLYKGNWKIEKEIEYQGETEKEHKNLILELESLQEDLSDTTIYFNKVFIRKNRITGRNRNNRKSYKIQLEKFDNVYY